MVLYSHEWLTFGGIAWLLLDAATIVWLSASLSRRALGEAEPTTLKAGFAIAIAFAYIVATTVLIGWIFGTLDGRAATLFRLAIFGSLLASSVVRQAAQASLLAFASRIRSLPTALSGILANRSIGRSLLAGMIVLALLIALAFAIIVFPSNSDTHTYRYPRVGMWLQEGYIHFFDTNDQRQRYIPFFCEIAMTWLCSFFPTGYPLTALPNFIGGVMLLISIWEFCRLLRFDKWARLVACAIAIGMPNVYLQFSTTQTDLLTAGLLNFGIVFAWREAAIGRRPGNVVGAGLCLGLAIGVKSTVSYFAPFIALWLVAVFLIHRRPVKASALYAAQIGAVAIAIGGFAYARNFYEYGNPFAPTSSIATIHQGSETPLSERWKFVAVQHFWQSIQPHSNPAIIQPLLAPAAQAIQVNLSNNAPNALFKEKFDSVLVQFANIVVSEDIVSFGAIPILLATLSFPFLIPRIKRAEDATLLCAFICLILFFAFFFTLQYPSAWSFRFFVIQAPFIAILGTRLLFLEPLGRYVAIPIVLLAFINAFESSAQNILGGWKLVSNPSSNAAAVIYDRLSDLANAAELAGAKSALIFPENAIISPYFRNEYSPRFESILIPAVHDAQTPIASALRERGFDSIIASPGLLEDRLADWEIVASWTDFPDTFDAVRWEPKSPDGPLRP